MEVTLSDLKVECKFTINQEVYADKSVGEIVKCRLEKIIYTLSRFGLNVSYEVYPLKSAAVNPSFQTTRIYATPEEAFK
jgi:hypothetical protein